MPSITVTITKEFSGDDAAGAFELLNCMQRTTEDEQMSALVDMLMEDVPDLMNDSTWEADYQYERGDQIALVPFYAETNVNHAAVRYGFVTGQSHGCVYCRFWEKGQPGTLRENAPVEAHRIATLVPHKSVDAAVVEDAIKERGLW